MTQLVRSIVEARGATRVPESVIGDADPMNDAIQWAKRNGMTPTSPDADRYRYAAHRTGGGWVVQTMAQAMRFELNDRGRPTPPRKWFDRSGFEDVELVEWSARDLADALSERLTVADLRDARRRAGASYERGSTKHEMAAQLVEQAPEAAKRLALDSRSGRGL